MELDGQTVYALIALGFAITFTLFALAWIGMYLYGRWRHRRRMPWVAAPGGKVRTPTRRELQQARRMFPPTDGE